MTTTTGALLSRPDRPLTVVALSATTPAAASEMHERIYGSAEIRFGTPTDRAFSWRYRAVGDNEVTFGTSISSVSRRGTVTTDDHHVFSWIAAGGRVTLQPDAKTPLAVTTTTLTPNPRGCFLRFVAQPTAKRFLRISNAYLQAISVACGGREAELHPARRPASDRFLQSLIETLAPQLLDPHLASMQRAAVNATIALAVIDSYGPAASMVKSGGRRTLRHAQEWIVANAQHPLTNSDIAVSIGISARGLEKTFQQHSSSSPQEFLRRYRLERAHQDLTRSSPASTSVAAIANFWGLRHLGRFSKQHVQIYGELPSATLRRPANQAHTP